MGIVLVLGGKAFRWKSGRIADDRQSSRSALVSGTATGEQLVYYDTATAAVAGASFFAVLRAKHLSRMELVLTLCTAIVLLVSFRPSILISLVISSVIVLLLNKYYRGMIKRVAISSRALILAGLIALPSLLSTFAERLAVSYATIRGNGDDVSTGGHMDDILVVLQHALERPLGYGSLTPQLTGLFVQSGSIYVHNELLLDWLRIGFIWFLAVLLLQISLLRDAFKALRQRPDQVSVSVATAAFLMPMFVIASVSAPFLTTTNRWPALVGLAAGILAAHNTAAATNAPPGEDFGVISPATRWPAVSSSARFRHRENF